MRGRESVSSRPTIAPIHRNIIIHGNHHHRRHHRHHQYHHRTARSRFNERTRHRTRFVSRFVSWTVEFAPRFFSSSRPCLMPQKARLQKAAAFRGLSSEKFPRSAAIKHRQPYGTRVHIGQSFAISSSLSPHRMRHTLFFTFYLHALARFARRGLARQPILRYTALHSIRIDII